MLAQLIAIKIYRERVLKQKIAATQQRVLALTEQHKKLLQQYQHIKLVWCNHSQRLAVLNQQEFIMHQATLSACLHQINTLLAALRSIEQQLRTCEAQLTTTQRDQQVNLRHQHKLYYLMEQLDGDTPT